MRSTTTHRFTFPCLYAPLLTCLVMLGTASAAADDPPPSQRLTSDPGPPHPRIGLSANAVGIVLADYALRLDWSPQPFHALTLEVGESRRHGGDAVLVELGWTLLPMDQGLEGFFVNAAVGIAWCGPWNGDDPAARSLGRLGGEVGWQFLWADLSITLAAGATGFWSPDQAGAVWVEPRGRVALGIVFR